MRRSNRGYTLIESLVVGGISALLLVSALPSLSETMQRSQIASLHNQMLAAFALARLTAIESRTSGAVCPLSANETCRTNGDWSRGWMVFVDHNGDGLLNGADAPLLVNAFSPNAGSSIYSGQFRPTVRYARNGMSQGSNLTIRFCLEGRATSAIIVNNAGRPRVERDPERLRSYSCAD